MAYTVSLRPEIGTLSMQVRQEATQPFAVKISFGQIVAKALLCGLLFWPAAGYCKDSSVPMPTQIVSFPKAFSAGSLYQVRSGYEGSGTLRLSRTFVAPARGDVSVPKGMLLGLLLSYQAGDDLSCLDRMPTDVVAFLKIERLSINDQQFKALKCLSELKRSGVDRCRHY